MLGWKHLDSWIDGKWRPLICPSESLSQSLPFPSTPQYGGQTLTQKPLFMTSLDYLLLFPPEPNNMSGYRCICFLYCFWNQVLFIFRPERRWQSIWTSKKNLTFPLKNFHLLTIYGGGTFTDVVLGQHILTLILSLHLPVHMKAHGLTGSSVPITGCLLFMVIIKCPCFQTYYICSDVKLLF